MDSSDRTTGLGVLGVGAAACAACCAGPVLGFLAATGIATVLGAVLFGVMGLVAALAVTAVLAHRRRRARHCSPTPTPVPVHAPEVRTGR